jgi:two-component system cell cycle response regulator
MNILHLETSRYFSRVIERVAQESGYQYRNETTIDSGLKALREWKFDLLIASQSLQDGPVDNLLAGIPNTNNRGLPVILVTGEGYKTDRSRFFCAGVMDYLPKCELFYRKLKQFFDVVNRGGEILEELRNLRVAVLDERDESIPVIRSIFQFYGVNHAEYFDSIGEMLSAGPFDLYLIDAVSGLTAGELFPGLREQNAHSGIIVISDITNQLGLSHSLSLGADDFIVRPFDARSFTAKLKGVVRHLILLRELEDLSRQMEDRRKRDSLTGLWNHSYIHEYLVHSMDSTQTGELSVLLIDLDNFRQLNDRFGHLAGDDVLLEAADTIIGELGDIGEIGRYGDDRFLVVLPDRGLDEARKIAGHLLRHIRGLGDGKHGFPVTASCGLAGIGEEEDAMKLIELAEERLGEAKSSGRDRAAG